MKVVKLLTLLLIIFFSSHAITSADEASYDINSPEVKDIASKLSMQDHETHDLGTCATKQRYYGEISELLNEGKTKEEVLDYYYSMYGEEGLIAPKKKGFSLTAWLTPFVVLGIAGFALFIGLKKMIKNQKSPLFEETREPNIEDEITTSIIEEERKKYY
ncbi:cytochrome c-type biogenesis protein CcmH [Bacillaceae bacterium IKA-2]|nr:cytochrome c-type biogenesis protein CcmH [Bacillaceae bacterium IKA-2]